MNGPIVTLLTDFGDSDGYVPAMKGIVLGVVPHAVLVDAAHTIPPHDIKAASWVLAQYAFSYPAKTIHIAVVDPGVGTKRDILVATAGGQLFFAPNNGLLHWVSRRASGFQVWRLKKSIHRPEEVSATFHGRDIIAYAAGRLAGELDDVEALTEPIEELVVPAWGDVISERGGIKGQIIHIDRFGNCITSIHRTHLETLMGRGIVIEVGEGTLKRMHRTYGDVRAGSPLAIVGSHDNLEIAISRGSAEQDMNLSRGDDVRVLPA
jgi:hypothetical protein